MGRQYGRRLDALAARAVRVPVYERLRRDVRAGSLRARFDVIVLPDATYDQMLNGMAPGSMPDPYTGGMTARGVANVREFVSSGGTLVAMDRAAELPITTFGLPITNVTSGVPNTDFYIP